MVGLSETVDRLVPMSRLALPLIDDAGSQPGEHLVVLGENLRRRQRAAERRRRHLDSSSGSGRFVGEYELAVYYLPGCLHRPGIVVRLFAGFVRLRLVQVRARTLVRITRRCQIPAPD